MLQPTLLAMFGLGYYELIIVAVVILVLFGHRLPTVMRSLGTGINEFKQGLSGVDAPQVDQAKTIDEQKGQKA